MPSEQALIAQLAQRYGVDPKAALAIASVEGGFRGAVGDHGTSFGPFQLHVGGALPHGIHNPQAWANSTPGISYALQHIGSVAHGLRGRQAVAAISSRFERPADVPGEIAKAMSRYGGRVPSGGGMPPSGSHSGGPGGAPNSKLIMQLVQQILASTAAPTPSQQIQDALPVQRSLYPPTGGA